MTYIVTNVTDTKINPYVVTINDLPGNPIPIKPSEAINLELYFTRNQLNDSRDIKIKLDRGDITVDTMGTNPSIRWHVDAAVSTGPISLGALTIRDGTTIGDATVLDNLTTPPNSTDNALLVYVGNDVKISDGGNSITIDDGGLSITVDAIGLDIRHLSHTIDSVKSYTVDENGNPYTSVNPLHIDISSSIDLDVNLQAGDGTDIGHTGDSLNVSCKKGTPEPFVGNVSTSGATITPSKTTTAISVLNPKTNSSTDLLEVSFDGGTKWYPLWRKEKVAVETEISSFKIKSNGASVDYVILATVK